jgi:hypothetical protein
MLRRLFRSIAEPLSRRISKMLDRLMLGPEQPVALFQRTYTNALIDALLYGSKAPKSPVARVALIILPGEMEPTLARFFHDVRAHQEFVVIGPEGFEGFDRHQVPSFRFLSKLREREGCEAVPTGNWYRVPMPRKAAV